MTAWTFNASNRLTGLTQELVFLAQRRFSFKLNRAPSLTATLPLNHPSVEREWLTPGVSEMLVYRDGEPLDSGFCFHDLDLDAASDNPRLQLTWGGFQSMLEDALVYGQASPYSGTTLPITWINTYQARTGTVSAITAGTTTGTATSQSRTIQQDDSISDAIISLAESQNGFDFNINANRALDLWYPQRGEDRGLVLEWGTNVRGFKYKEDAGPGKIVTDARVRGGIDNGTPAASSNATAQAVYGRREASITAAGEIDVAGTYLQTFGDTIVSERGNPLIIPQLVLDQNHPTTQWGNWWLGDTVIVRASFGDLINIDAQYRIVGVNIDLDEADNEKISLDLNLANE